MMKIIRTCNIKITCNYKRLFKIILVKSFLTEESLKKVKTCEKLLGMKIDNMLNFNNHEKGPYKKVNNKLRALARETPYSRKKKLLINFFFQCTV